jgi:glycosyl transferase family 1
VGGTPEALVDGENGLLVPPGDVASLAAAVTRLLDAPAVAARLGRAARRSIEDRFSIDRMAEATEHLYDELLTRASRLRRRRRFEQPSGQPRVVSQESTWSEQTPR